MASPDRSFRIKDVPLLQPGGGWRPPLFRRRAAFYVDGFNLHHSVAAFEKPYLHWLDLQALFRAFAPRGDVLKRTVWTTAFRPAPKFETERHQAYVDALEATGVRALTGHFVIHADGCNACGHMWQVAEEKQGDVNLSLALLDDAHENRFDVAYLLSGDGDLAAAARFLREKFPHKRLISVAPPGRGWNRHIVHWSHGRAAVQPEHMEAALLPAVVRGRGRRVERPALYEPPEVPRAKAHLTLVVSDGR